MFADQHMTQKSEIGKLGEDLACEYLIKKGYRVLERNFRKPWGELDIVAKYKDGTLVIVEVKTMRENPSLSPEDNLTKAKLEKLKRTALLYAGSKQELLRDKKGWRIDLIAVSISNLTNITDNYLVSHYENI